MIIKEDVPKLVKRQLNIFWDEMFSIEIYHEKALKRLEFCFEHINNKYYSEDDKLVFSPYHSVQYSIYLYFLANTVFMHHDNNKLATLLYYLNKILHGVDIYFEVELPEIFCCEHPIGSVLGRAKYSNKFFFYQGCTVGGNNFKYPTIGENVIMYSNSSILGDSKIGDNVIVSANCIIKDEIIPDNCFVFGSSPNLIIKEKDNKYLLDHIGRVFKFVASDTTGMDGQIF